MLKDKKLIRVLISVAVIGGLIGASILGACAAPTPTPTPTPELPAMSWRLGAAAAATHQGFPMDQLHAFADAVEARTNGKVKVPVFVSGELGLKRETSPVAVKNDLIQMAYVACGHIAGTFTHLGVFSMPFLMGSVEGPLPDANKMAEAVQDISVREFSKMGVAPAVFWVEVPSQLISKVTIDNVSDLDGMNVRAWDEVSSSIVSSLNGVPVIMGVGETYLALQRGVVDAVITGVVAMNVNSLPELAKDLYLINLPPSADYLIYNIEWFESLPDEYQKILLEEWENLDRLLDKGQPMANEEALDLMRAAGVTLHELRAEEVKGMVNAVMTLWEDWANQEAVNREALEAVKGVLGL